MWSIIKTLWKNPRTHALLVLTFFILFFTIIILMTTSGSTTEKNIESKEESFSHLINYSDTITIQYHDQIEMITGIHKLEEHLIAWNDVLQEDNLLTIHNLEWNMVSFRPANLSKIFEKGTYISTTNYAGGRKKKVYEYSCHEYGLPLNGICEFGFLELEKIEQVEITVPFYQINIVFEE